MLILTEEREVFPLCKTIVEEYDEFFKDKNENEYTTLRRMQPVGKSEEDFEDSYEYIDVKNSYLFLAHMLLKYLPKSLQDFLANKKLQPADGKVDVKVWFDFGKDQQTKMCVHIEAWDFTVPKTIPEAEKEKFATLLELTLQNFANNFLIHVLSVLEWERWEDKATKYKFCPEEITISYIIPYEREEESEEKEVV